MRRARCDSAISVVLWVSRSKVTLTTTALATSVEVHQEADAGLLDVLEERPGAGVGPLVEVRTTRRQRENVACGTFLRSHRSHRSPDGSGSPQLFGESTLLVRQPVCQDGRSAQVDGALRIAVRRGVVHLMGEGHLVGAEVGDPGVDQDRRPAKRERLDELDLLT